MNRFGRKVSSCCLIGSFVSGFVGSNAANAIQCGDDNVMKRVEVVEKTKPSKAYDGINDSWFMSVFVEDDDGEMYKKDTYEVRIDRSTLQIRRVDGKEVGNPLYFKNTSKIEKQLKEFRKLEEKFEKCSPREENLLKQEINYEGAELAKAVVESYRDQKSRKELIVSLSLVFSVAILAVLFCEFKSRYFKKTKKETLSVSNSEEQLSSF